MAYTAEEFGQRQIFVRAFPEPGEKWQVSAGIGTDPVWHPDGSAIFYISGGSLMRANVRTGATVSVESTQVLFPWSYRSGFSHTSFDIHPDGDRFIVQRLRSVSGYGKVYVVTSWFDELRQRMGEDGR
jgi:Tol biopolymer transport system component